MRQSEKQLALKKLAMVEKPRWRIHLGSDLVAAAFEVHVADCAGSCKEMTEGPVPCMDRSLLYQLSRRLGATKCGDRATLPVPTTQQNKDAKRERSDHASE